MSRDTARALKKFGFLENLNAEGATIQQLMNLTTKETGNTKSRKQFRSNRNSPPVPPPKLGVTPSERKAAGAVGEEQPTSLNTIRGPKTSPKGTM